MFIVYRRLWFVDNFCRHEVVTLIIQNRTLLQLILAIF